MGGMPRSLSMSQLPMQYRSPGIIQFSGGMTVPTSIPASQWMVCTLPYLKLFPCLTLSLCNDQLTEATCGLCDRSLV